MKSTTNYVRAKIIGTRDLVNATLRIDDDGQTVSYQFDSELGTGAASGSSFFFTLLDLRRELESKGLLLMVQGARLTVWPSGMSGDMYRGEVALDRDPNGTSEEIVVNIFDTAEGDDVVTVAEQEAFDRTPELSPRMKERIKKLENRGPVEVSSPDRYVMPTSVRSREYLDEIVSHLEEAGLSTHVAVSRVNDKWKDIDLSNRETLSILFEHEIFFWVDELAAQQD